MLGQNKDSQANSVTGISAEHSRTGSLPGPAPATAGPHRQDILNKLDPTVDSMHGGTQVLGPGINTHQQHSTQHEHMTGHTSAVPRESHQHTTTSSGVGHSGVGTSTGPVHDSHLANQLDPRVHTTSGGAAVPSSGVHSHQNTVGTGVHNQGLNTTTGGTHTHGTTTGTGGAYTQGQSNVPEGTYGPHSSRMANALDPRVDSDRDRHTQGTTTGVHAHGTTGSNTLRTTGGTTHGTIGSNTHGTTGQSNVPEGTYGPHSSRIANAADPRVDSDHDRHTHGTTGTHTHGTTGHNTLGTTGAQTHATTGNDTVGATGGHTTTVHGGPLIHPGPASKTAGPHSSNLLNKLDPRVDSKATVQEQKEYRTS